MEGAFARRVVEAWEVARGFFRRRKVLEGMSMPGYSLSWFLQLPAELETRDLCLYVANMQVKTKQRERNRRLRCIMGSTL